MSDIVFTLSSASYYFLSVTWKSIVRMTQLPRRISKGNLLKIFRKDVMMMMVVVVVIIIFEKK